MNERNQQLSELRSYIGRVEKDITLALQALQWDRRRLLEDATAQTNKVACENSHRRPPGYDELDVLLPITCSDTALILKTTEISQIIRAAAHNDPSFKMGDGDPGCRPVAQSADRLQSTYTQDERRALYDAVVARAPPAPSVLDLPSLPGDDGEKTKPKTFLEVMAQLRDMKRRRTKYKVPTKSKNYSQVLREVIKSQMELYTGIKEEIVTDHKPRAFIFHHNKEIKQERPSEPRDVFRNEIDPSSNRKPDKHDKTYRQYRDYHHEHNEEKYSGKRSHDRRKGKQLEKYSNRASQSDRPSSRFDLREKNTHSDEKTQRDKHAKHETHESQVNRDYDSKLSPYSREHKSRDKRDHSDRKSRDHKVYSSRESRDCNDYNLQNIRDQREHSSRRPRDHRNYSSRESRKNRGHGSRDLEENKSRHSRPYDGSRVIKNYKSRDRSNTPGKDIREVEIKQVKIEPNEF